MWAAFGSQLVWWAIPAVIIVAIAIINWKSTHALDPYRSDSRPISAAHDPGCGAPVEMAFHLSGARDRDGQLYSVPGGHAGPF